VIAPPTFTVLSMRVTGVELLEESSVYKYTLEYITTHLPEESSENRMRLLEGYSTLCIQVPLVMEHPKGQSYDLAKQLSHYLYFFSFFFLFLLIWIYYTRRKYRKVSHDKCHISLWSHVRMS